MNDERTTFEIKASGIMAESLTVVLTSQFNSAMIYPVNKFD